MLFADSITAYETVRGMVTVFVHSKIQEACDASSEPARHWCFSFKQPEPVVAVVAALLLGFA